MDGFARLAGATSQKPLTPSTSKIGQINDDIVWVEESTAPLQPLYFVRHTNDSFSVAKPQPSLYPKIDPMPRVVAKTVSFLLSQAPMMDAPDSLERAAHSVTRFAYVHPKTFAKFTRGAYSPKTGAPYVQIRPSPTKWVLTTLMPEDRVIYTPNPIPGLEKILAS